MEDHAKTRRKSEGREARVITTQSLRSSKDRVQINVLAFPECAAYGKGF